MRNYGRILQDMVTYACTLQDTEEQQSLVIYIAQCMRQKNLVWNKDQEAGMARVQEDLVKLSNGQLNCDFEAFKRLMNQPVQMPQNGNGQFKKRKK